VNFLRISCAGCKALPVGGFGRSQKIIFTAYCAVLFLFTAEKFSADLTIAVLGRLAFETYHPDTLLALADKKIRSRSVIAYAPDLTGLLRRDRKAHP